MNIDVQLLSIMFFVHNAAFVVICFRNRSKPISEGFILDALFSGIRRITYNLH